MIKYLIIKSKNINFKYYKMKFSILKNKINKNKKINKFN